VVVRCPCALTAGKRCVIAGWQEVRDLIGEAITSVFNDQANPQEAAQTLKKPDAVIGKT